MLRNEVSGELGCEGGGNPFFVTIFSSCFQFSVSAFSSISLWRICLTMLIRTNETGSERTWDESNI